MEELEFETIFKRKEVNDIINSGQVCPLEDIYSIEDVALTIKSINKKIDFYDSYKKKKKSDIENEILVLKNREDFLKEIIIATLKKNKEKSLKFPGSCSVQSRSQNEAWKIDDEEEFIRLVNIAKKEGEKTDGIIKETVQYSVDKKNAYMFLDDLLASGRIEKFFSHSEAGQNVVHREPQKSIVVLKFEKNEEEEDSSDVYQDVSIVSKAEAYSEEKSYDKLF